LLGFLRSAKRCLGVLAFLKTCRSVTLLCLEVHSNRLCSIAGGVANFGGVPLTGALNTITDQTITMVDNDAIVRHTLTGETERDGTTTPVKIGVLMVWHKQDGSWKLLARQAGRLDEAPRTH